MWLFTKHGFYSAVCARQGEGGHNQPVNPDRIMVRARVRSHLEALKEHFSYLLANSEIKQFAGTDYAFRIFLDKSVWSQVLVGLNEEMDYDKEKVILAGNGSIIKNDFYRKLLNDELQFDIGELSWIFSDVSCAYSSGIIAAKCYKIDTSIDNILKYFVGPLGKTTELFWDVLIKLLQNTQDNAAKYAAQ